VEVSVDVNELLLDLFGRIDEHVTEAVSGMATESLTRSPEPGSNPIGWLVWHLTRVQDHHISELLGQDQAWVTGPWAERFDLEADPDDTGYGHSDDDVAAVRPRGADALLEYHAAVSGRTREFIRGLTADDLDRVIDDRWDPPVTLGVRLVSVADDDIQHAGQAVYVRGLLDRR
jgi:uncharacterized damage-inducible protein DinB